jgi:hypothetical protein
VLSVLRRQTVVMAALQDPEGGASGEGERVRATTTDAVERLREVKYVPCTRIDLGDIEKCLDAINDLDGGGSAWNTVVWTHFALLGRKVDHLARLFNVPGDLRGALRLLCREAARTALDLAHALVDAGRAERGRAGQGAFGVYSHGPALASRLSRLSLLPMLTQAAHAHDTHTNIKAAPLATSASVAAARRPSPVPPQTHAEVVPLRQPLDAPPARWLGRSADASSTPSDNTGADTLSPGAGWHRLLGSEQSDCAPLLAELALWQHLSELLLDILTPDTAPLPPAAPVPGPTPGAEPATALARLTRLHAAVGRAAGGGAVDEALVPSPLQDVIEGCEGALLSTVDEVLSRLWAATSTQTGQQETMNKYVPPIAMPARRSAEQPPPPSLTSVSPSLARAHAVASLGLLQPLWSALLCRFATGKALLRARDWEEARDRFIARHVRVSPLPVMRSQTDAAEMSVIVPGRFSSLRVELDSGLLPDKAAKVTPVASAWLSAPKTIFSHLHMGASVASTSLGHSPRSAYSVVISTRGHTPREHAPSPLFWPYRTRTPRQADMRPLRIAQLTEVIHPDADLVAARTPMGAPEPDYATPSGHPAADPASPAYDTPTGRPQASPRSEAWLAFTQTLLAAQHAQGHRPGSIPRDCPAGLLWTLRAPQPCEWIAQTQAWSGIRQEIVGQQRATEWEVAGLLNTAKLVRS